MREIKGYKCPGCGAMLDPADSEKVSGIIICRYCNTRLQLEPIEEKNTIGPRSSGAIGKTRQLSLIVAAVVAGVILIIGISVGIITTRKSRPHMATSWSVQGLATQHVVNITNDDQAAFPISCTGNDSIVISNQSFTKKENILVATDRCNAAIDNSSMISSNYAVRALSNGTILINNSDIISNGTALWASDNTHVTINNCRITGEKVAIYATGNAVVTLANCTLSAPIAAETELNGRIVISNSDIHGETKGNVEKH